MTSAAQPDRPSQPLVLERTYSAALEDVWALWTTRAGIESWWGPEGFMVEVASLNLQVGGALEYVMTATGHSQIEFMQRAGLPLATKAKLTFTAIEPGRRLAYVTLADFVPGVAPYEIATQVEVFVEAQGVRMTVSVDRMHDETWTERAIAGWLSQLSKLPLALSEPSADTGR